MRALIFGGRDFNLHGFIFDTLDVINEDRGPITEVIAGGAPGVDHWGEQWALERAIPVAVFKADWDKHGKAAGPIRNQAMADQKPDVGIQFPGGRGTADMASRLRRAGIEVIEVTVCG
jgi:hypothetical protein